MTTATIERTKLSDGCVVKLQQRRGKWDVLKLSAVNFMYVTGGKQISEAAARSLYAYHTLEQEDADAMNDEAADKTTRRL